MKEYDVVIAGGSIAGLLTAREIAKNGNSVLVLEEGFEIGTPDHCGGLVSKTALNDLGLDPLPKTFDTVVSSAQIFSPSGHNITIDSKKQNVIVVSRRELDKQAAMQAQNFGAEIMVNTSYKAKTSNGVMTSIGEITCKIIVDCRGVNSLVNNDRDGILQSISPSDVLTPCFVFSLKLVFTLISAPACSACRATCLSSSRLLTTITFCFFELISICLPLGA